VVTGLKLSSDGPSSSPVKTNAAAYQRLVSTTFHGPSQLSVLHLAVEPLTARDEARYWLKIAYPTCIRNPSEYYHLVRFGKTRMVWLPDSAKHFEVMFIRFDRIHERDGQTVGPRMTA